MSEQNQKPEIQENSKSKEELDSLGIPVKKNPWLWFALLQIPIVIIMILIVAYLVSQRSGS